MASQALRVVESRVLVELLVGVMTRQTTDARIVWIPAAAFFQPVGLEPDVRDVANAHHLYLDRSAMTSPTKIRQVVGFQLGRTENVGFFSPWLDFIAAECLPPGP